MKSKPSTPAYGKGSTATGKTLVFEGTPVSVNALYWHSGRIRFVTPGGKAWKEYVALSAKVQWGRKPLTGRLSVAYRLYFRDKLRRDLTNYEKAMGDALNGIVWEDDSQIDHICFERFLDKLHPRVEITVTELP